MTPKVCDICGKEYTPRAHNQKYCSTECAVKAEYQARGIPYRPIEQRKRAKKFSGTEEGRSMEDRGSFGIESNCARCGKYFLRSADHVYRRGQKVFCSWGCMRAYDKEKEEKKRRIGR